VQGTDFIDCATAGRRRALRERSGLAAALVPGDVEQASLERDFVDLARQAHRALGAERQPLELVVGRAESVPGIASIAAYCSVECRAGRDDKVTGASLS